MEKKDQVDHILFKIKEQADELLDNHVAEDLSAEELVVLCIEIITSSPVSTIEYSSPIGTVDTKRVTIMLGDDFEFPLFGEEYYEED